jgi:signal transduction histidine kinase
MSLPPDPRSSIGTRVFLLVTVGMLVPVFTMGTIGTRTLESMRQQMVSDREQWARSAADRLDDALRSDLEALQQVATAPHVDIAAGMTEPIHAALRSTWLRFHSSDSVFLINDRLELLHVEPTHETTLPPEVMAAVRTVLDNRKPEVTGLVNGVDAVPRVYCLVPIFDWQLRAVGVVGLAANAHGPRLLQLAAGARPGPKGSVDLLDETGALISSTGPASPDDVAGHAKLARALVARHGAVAGTCSGCHDERGAAGESHEILAAAALKVAPWVVRIREPEPAALELARVTPTYLFSAGVALFALALFFAWGISRSVRRPLEVLDGHAAQLAAGRLDEPIPNLGFDEIGRLGHSFEHMRQALADSLAKLERARSSLEERVTERTAELAVANKELATREAQHVQLLRKIITAQEDERRRIARELHDETSQVLAALMMRIDRALGDVKDEATRFSLQEVRGMATRALDDVHSLVLDLRPSVLDDLGLFSAIRWMADRHLKPLGITFRCEVGVDRRLPSEVETTLFRVAQEAITNIAKHSQASSVLVQIEERGGELAFEIEDDGKGFDVAAASRPEKKRVSFGLMGMHERVELLGGSLKIESSPGEGTRLVLFVPLGREA